MRFLLTLLVLVAGQATADSVVPTRTIRANVVIQEGDVMLRAGSQGSGFNRLADVVGQEARVVLYPGRPIRIDDVGPPAVVQRNQVVRLSFTSNGLKISTEGRVLERGGIGDLVRVMNMSSRATLFGKVRADGTIDVSP